MPVNISKQHQNSCTFVWDGARGRATGSLMSAWFRRFDQIWRSTLILPLSLTQRWILSLTRRLHTPAHPPFHADTNPHAPHTHTWEIMLMDAIQVTTWNNSGKSLLHWQPSSLEAVSVHCCNGFWIPTASFCLCYASTRRFSTGIE